MLNEITLAACLSRYANYYQSKLFLLVSEFGSLTSLYQIWYGVKHSKSIPLQLRHDLHKSWQMEQLSDQEKLLERYEIRTILSDSKLYPPLLREIPDKPYLIYVRGEVKALATPILLSCVGTRTMTRYAERVIPQLLHELAGRDACVISGLALGVDALVHKTALGLNIKTVAVLGGGLDAIEPQTNRVIGEAILTAGCLVSEYPPGVRPQKHHFLERNRIIAGLSRATLVIEGRRTSGALVTARRALAYGREVGAVPGAINLATSEASHILLRDGAWPIMDGTDVASMLNLDPKAHTKPIAHKNKVHEALTVTDANSDTLSVTLGVPIHEIHAQITELELEGLVAQSSTGAYYLKG